MFFKNIHFQFLLMYVCVGGAHECEFISEARRGWQKWSWTHRGVWAAQSECWILTAGPLKKQHSVTLSHLSRPTNLTTLKTGNLPNPTQSFKAADKMSKGCRTQSSHPGLDWDPLTRVQTWLHHHLSFSLKACCFLAEKDNVAPWCKLIG